MDPHLPRQADLEEAGRGPHGQRQGLARVFRGGDRAGQGALRDGRGGGGDRPRGVRARRREAADPHDVRASVDRLTEEGDGEDERAPREERGGIDEGTAGAAPRAVRAAHAARHAEPHQEQRDRARTPADRARAHAPQGEIARCQMTEAAPNPGPAKNQRALTGRVVSEKMNLTVTVLVERQVMHPTIGKVVTRTKTYHAHNEGNRVHLGDTVVIEECRPISKTKAWKVTRLVEKARPE